MANFLLKMISEEVFIFRCCSFKGHLELIIIEIKMLCLVKRRAVTVVRLKGVRPMMANLTIYLTRKVISLKGVRD